MSDEAGLLLAFFGLILTYWQHAGDAEIPRLPRDREAEEQFERERRSH